jgi:hypothetical protein
MILTTSFNATLAISQSSNPVIPANELVVPPILPVTIQPATFAGHSNLFRMSVDVAPGIGQKITSTLYKNGAATPVVLVIAGAVQTTVSDLTHIVTMGLTDTWYWGCVETGGAIASNFIFIDHTYFTTGVILG